MSTLDSQPDRHKHAELNRRVIDLVEGRGSQISRRLTKEMLKAFPSFVELVPAEYQQRLQQILRLDD